MSTLVAARMHHHIVRDDTSSNGFAGAPMAQARWKRDDHGAFLGHKLVPVARRDNDHILIVDRAEAHPSDPPVMSRRDEPLFIPYNPSSPDINLRDSYTEARSDGAVFVPFDPSQGLALRDDTIALRADGAVFVPFNPTVEARSDGAIFVPFDPSEGLTLRDGSIASRSDGAVFIPYDPAGAGDLTLREDTIASRSDGATFVPYDPAGAGDLSLREDAIASRSDSVVSIAVEPPSSNHYRLGSREDTTVNDVPPAHPYHFHVGTVVNPALGTRDSEEARSGSQPPDVLPPKKRDLIVALIMAVADALNARQDSQEEVN
ncbi:hypothetical protein EIP91_003550 [Steccherinum ochraceum]|uniref:Uncharacterized protein n=1 Tax=Steccherinum ochraceum TaxID=92696 RepID=A0A4R0RCU4_9APHY|nr:hypothetical protein EIP91_003550 [Steccherinum ochraceum]